MTLRFLSAEWVAEGRKRLEASKDFQTASKGLELSLTNVITDTPEKKTLYVRYVFKDGEIQALDRGHDEAIAKRPTDFTVTASYETFGLITQGKLSIAQAFLGRKLKLDGSMPRAMKFVKPMDTMNKVLRAIPTVYG